MTRIFLDTNILIDYIENRAGGKSAELILRQAVAGHLSIFASTLTFANMAYIIGRKHTQKEVCSILGALEPIITILPLDRQHLRNTIAHPCKDFEDMLQYQCAITGNCNVILTNNKKDFADFSTLPLYTAQEFLDTLKR